jgi:hypothetical protein
MTSVQAGAERASGAGQRDAVFLRALHFPQVFRGFLHCMQSRLGAWRRAL